MEVRQVFEHEIESAFPVIAELRQHLDLEEFLLRVKRQSATGYELWGAFEGRTVVGAIGFRPLTTLARGAHLHIDDLAVTESRREDGIGRALIAAAEAEARRHGLEDVYLDSRPEAVEFYSRLGYTLHSSVAVKKRLARA